MASMREIWSPRRIRTLREAKGLSCDELAGLIGVTRTTVYRWEQGQMRPSVDRLLDLAEALDTHAGFFFERAETEVA